MLSGDCTVFLWCRILSSVSILELLNTSFFELSVDSFIFSSEYKDFDEGCWKIENHVVSIMHEFKKLKQQYNVHLLELFKIFTRNLCFPNANTNVI